MNVFRALRRRFGLSCRNVNEFLVEYLEGTLDPRLEKRFEAHVKRCPQCQAYVDQYRQTVALVRETSKTAEVDFPDRLVEHTITFLREHALETRL